MSKFNVGDRARYTAAAADPEARGHAYAGKEVTIVSVDINNPVDTYQINIIGRFGNYVWCREGSLEPILKRPELGTIEELKMITGGWTPGHVTKRKVNS